MPHWQIVEMRTQEAALLRSASASLDAAPSLACPEMEAVYRSELLCMLHWLTDTLECGCEAGPELASVVRGFGRTFELPTIVV